MEQSQKTNQRYSNLNLGLFCLQARFYVLKSQAGSKQFSALTLTTVGLRMLVTKGNISWCQRCPASDKDSTQQEEEACETVCN